MKNLWTKTPPYYADTFGVQDIVSLCGGIGIIDDSSGYHSWGNSTGLLATGIRMEDAIRGTQDKILDVFRNQAVPRNPGFIILCDAPCASMIGTDLEDTCRIMEEESGIPSVSVNVTGHKTYDNGVARSLEAVAKKLVRPSDKHDGVNFIGLNSLDMPDNVQSSVKKYIRDICADENIRINAFWGDCPLEDIKNSARASLNIVLTVSGIPAARYMESAFGIPFAVTVPMGESGLEAFSGALKGLSVSVPSIEKSETPQVVIVGEQVSSNAIRAEIIKNYGMKDVRVYSYFTMDKSLMLDGDIRIRGEEDMENALNGSGIVIADPVMKPLIHSGTDFIPLPSKTFIWGDGEQPVLTGGELNSWISKYL